MTKRGNDEVDPDVSRSLDFALSVGRSHGGPRMPWESNEFLRDVMGDDHAPWLFRPPSLRTLSHVPLVPDKPTTFSVPARKIKIRYAVHHTIQQWPDYDRANVLLKWAELLLLEPGSSTAGKMLLRCADDEKMVMNTISDLFRSKATSTLKICVASLSLYFGWALEHYPDMPMVPVCEEMVYDYACHCRDAGLSASRVDTLISSLR